MVSEQAFGLSKEIDVASLVGNTPLVRLRAVVRDLPEGVEVYAKAEHLNPSGSVKDRAARAMIFDGERRGALTRDKIILDATSGNTGIAYAMIGASRGYRVQLTLPANATPERKRILKIYGAELVETDPLQGIEGSQILAEEMARRAPEKYFHPNQYDNDANWRAHYDGTALEIWEQTRGRATHFVAGLGTTGTFTGTTRRLKELNRNLRAYAVQPDSPMHGLEGMKYMKTAIVPKIFDSSLVDETLEVSTEEAQAMARRLALEEGLLVGVSSGANVFAALRLAKTMDAREAVIVTVLCDSGSRYLSEEFWETKK